MTYSRRTFLGLAAATGIGLSLAGCSNGPAEAPATGGASEQNSFLICQIEPGLGL